MLLALLPVIAAFESKRRSDRVRVAMKEIKEGRRKSRSGRPPGRPRRLTPDIEARILDLRRAGMKWSVVAQRVQLPSGTCRKVRPRTDTPSVGKGRGGFETPSDGAPPASADGAGA